MKNLKFLMILLLIISCRNSPATKYEGITQGIKGEISWLEGNQMPSPTDNTLNRDGGKPVQREIHIYELINIRDTESKNGFFGKIKGNLIKKTVSDAKGHFEITLKPGEYSLFVKEEQGLYANLFDTNNNVFPVVVNENKVTEVKVIIDYKAAY